MLSMIKSYECYFGKQNHLFGIYVNIRVRVAFGSFACKHLCERKMEYLACLNDVKTMHEDSEKVAFHFSWGDIYSTRSWWLVFHGTGILYDSWMKEGASILSSVVLRCSLCSVYFIFTVMSIAVSLGSPHF